MEQLFKEALTYASYHSLGFREPSQSNLPQLLKGIYPSGGTNLRDAIAFSTKLILEMNQISQKLSTERWTFVHIVLTDGEDSGSETSVEDLAKMFLLIGLIPDQRIIKTEFIGVNMNENSREAKALKAISILGGQNSNLYNVDSMDLKKTFQRILFNVGLIHSKEAIGVTDGTNIALGVQDRLDAVLSIEKQRFCCLFTLDMSGSMSGSSWSKVVESVTEFINFLGPNDLVGSVVFNDKISLVLPQEIGESNDYESKNTWTSKNKYIRQVPKKKSFFEKIFCCFSN